MGANINQEASGVRSGAKTPTTNDPPDTARPAIGRCFSYFWGRGVVPGMVVPWVMVEGPARATKLIGRQLDWVKILPPADLPLPRLAPLPRGAGTPGSEGLVVALVHLCRQRCLYTVASDARADVLWEQKRSGWWTQHQELTGFYLLPPMIGLTLVEHQCVNRWRWQPVTTFRRTAVRLDNVGGELRVTGGVF